MVVKRISYDKNMGIGCKNAGIQFQNTGIGKFAVTFYCDFFTCNVTVNSIRNGRGGANTGGGSFFTGAFIESFSPIL